MVTRPAQPDEIISVYGTGFGATAPASPTGLMVAAAAPLAGIPTAQSGATAVPVLWGGLVLSGEYQFNIRIPALAAGDQPLVVQVGAAQSQAGVYITIGQ